MLHAAGFEPACASPASSGAPAPGAPSATDELFTRVYAELRELAERLLAREPRGQTLQATALVHEAYLRLARTPDCWENRAHFFGAAARAIRRILIDRARSRRRLRRGGGERLAALQESDVTVAGAGAAEPVDVLALDEALGRLAVIDPQKARVVELRFFGGLTADETAEALGISPSSVARDWRFARIWLFRELGGGTDGALAEARP